MSEAKIYYSESDLFRDVPRGLWTRYYYGYIDKRRFKDKGVGRVKEIVKEKTGVQIDKLRVTGNTDIHSMWEGDVYIKSEKGIFWVNVTESMDGDFWILSISKLWTPKSKVVSARIPERLFKELQEFAAKRGMKISDIVQEALESYNKMLKAEYATEVDNAYAKYVFRVIDLINALFEEISTPTARLKVFARITERARYDDTGVPEHLTIDLGDYYIFIWTEIVPKS